MMGDQKLTERHRTVMGHIALGLNGIVSADYVAAKMGYRPARKGRLAVSGTLRALMRMGMVGRIPPHDQWDHADYFLTPEGRRVFGTSEPQP